MMSETDNLGPVYRADVDEMVWLDDWGTLIEQPTAEVLRHYVAARDEIAIVRRRLEYLERKMEAAKAELSRRTPEPKEI